MRAFKEEERSVLASVTLMKGITDRVQRIEKKPWVTCANYWQRVVYMKSPTMRQRHEKRFLSFVFYLFIHLVCHPHFSFYSFYLFWLSAFLDPHPPSAGIRSTFYRHPDLIGCSRRPVSQQFRKTTFWRQIYSYTDEQIKYQKSDKIWLNSIYWICTKIPETLSTKLLLTINNYNIW